MIEKLEYHVYFLRLTMDIFLAFCSDKWSSSIYENDVKFTDDKTGVQRRKGR